MNRRFRAVFLLSVFVACVYVWVWVLEEGRNDILRVVFFDVGQGDSIFIESPGGTQILIDGGVGGAVLRSLSREMGFFDRTLDVVIGTHPDADHIGGLVDVLKRYEVGSVVVTENKAESLVAEAFTSGIQSENADVRYARRGMRLLLDGGELEVLFPDRDPSMLESNTSSIIARLTYGDRTFLFTGDAPKNIEEYLLMSSSTEFKSDVLKIGHHGSRTSTSPLFLEAVAPAYAVISAGADNRYGHPHSEVVDLLTQNGVKILETAKEGSVAFETDGVNLWLDE